MNYLAIDPSVNACGWATCDDSYPVNNVSHYQYGVLRSNPGADWKSRARWIVDRLNGIYTGFYTKTEVVIEWPTYQNNARGMAAAREGDILKLAFLIGGISERFCIPFSMLFFYTPQQWKGSVPKHVTRAKFHRTFDGITPESAFMDHNAMDAVMMLRHHLDSKFSLTETTKT